MSIITSASLITVGTIFGIALVLSCSDNSPSPADAASCECAPAEAPIAGRIEIIANTQEIPANGDSGQAASCPDGAVFLSGGCGTANNQPADILLRQSRPTMNGNGWACEFRNNSSLPVEIKASAYCLIPLSQQP